MDEKKFYDQVTYPIKGQGVMAFSFETFNWTTLWARKVFFRLNWGIFMNP
jgi:hypothetical protein